MRKHTLVIIGALFTLVVYASFLVGAHYGSREALVALFKARVELSGEESLLLSERPASLGVSQEVITADSSQKVPQGPEKAPEAVSDGEKPLYFTQFRVIIDISPKDEQEEDFAIKQTKELASLIKALNSIRDVGIVGIKGGCKREGVVKYFVIE